MKIASKIIVREIAQAQCRVWRESGQHIIFTNGCFDILHKGHIQYLESARALGDRLVVGLNSDASTRRLKGNTRPINHEDSRAYLVASLSVVDLVVVFEEDTPLNLITSLEPDTLVKGGDYVEDDVIGGNFVKAHGGHVVIIPYVEGYSTTAIEEKIRALKRSNTTD